MVQGQARVSRDRVPTGGGSRGESALEVELAAHEGNGGGTPPARTALYELTAGAHYETFPLLTRPRVRLAVYPASGIGPTGRVIVRFLLSEQPPDLRQSQLTYVLGGQEQGECVDGPLGTITRPALPGAWQELELDLAADVERLGLPGGLDNSLHRLQLGLASDRPAVRARFAGLEIEPQHRGPASATRPARTWRPPPRCWRRPACMAPTCWRWPTPARDWPTDCAYGTRSRSTAW